MHLVFIIMSQSDNGSAELGKRPPPFSAWHKKKKRDNEERLKESSRVAKYRESKKESYKTK